jgi:hypothetical protein
MWKSTKEQAFILIGGSGWCHFSYSPIDLLLVALAVALCGKMSKCVCTYTDRQNK